MARDPKISEAMPFRLALWPLLPYSSQLPRVLSVSLLPSLLQSTARCLKEGILQALTKDSWGATDQVKHNTLLSLSVVGCLFLYKTKEVSSSLVSFTWAVVNPGFKSQSTVSTIQAPGSESRTCAPLDLTNLGSFASEILGLGMMVVEAKEEGADPRGEMEACTQGP